MKTEEWRKIKRKRAFKRHENLVASTKILANAGIKFEPKDYGQHLIIRTPFRINFWPSTGLWQTSQTESRGVHKLIKFIAAHTEK